MATIIRRIEGTESDIEVTFARPIEPDSRTGQRLLEFGAEEGVRLIREGEGIAGVECPQKAYLAFLQSVNASKETVAAVRRALDDSKKAQRERMRGR